MALCSVTDIKSVIDTVGRWTDAVIQSTIDDVDALIYIEGGKPLQGVLSPMASINNVVQSRYYVGEAPIHDIDRVFYGTTTKQELSTTTGYSRATTRGMIEIRSVGTSGITPDANSEIEIHYAPKIYNSLSIYRTTKRLLEMVDTTMGGTASKELEVITQKLEMVETLLAHRVGVQLSGDVQGYKSHYGVNMKKFNQDPDRNKYLATASNFS